MEVQQVLHMNGGDGETSYAKNSSIQNMILSGAKAIVHESILEFYSGSKPSFPAVLSVADLGCSSGPNTFSVVTDIVGTVTGRCRHLDHRPPEFQLFLNDLPGNDFNTVFRSLPQAFSGGDGREDVHCFIAAVAGSFYGRLFPTRSIHFFHSSSSLHWLSQVPPELVKGGDVVNKGKIYISEGSPKCVMDAYHLQFQKDFSSFLRMRAGEIVIGGRMVLVMMGRRTGDHAAEYCFLWDLLSDVLTDMVSQGFIEEEILDSFNAPYYCPSADEVTAEIQREGSFCVKGFEILTVDIAATQDHHITNGYHVNGDLPSSSPNGEITRGQRMAKCVQAVVQPMISTLVYDEDVIEDLFLRYRKALDEYFMTKKSELTNLMVSLERMEE